MSSRSKKHKDDVLSMFESSEGEFSGFECDEPFPSGASKKLKYVLKRVYDNNKSVPIEKSFPINPLGATHLTLTIKKVRMRPVRIVSLLPVNKKTTRLLSRMVI
ncbi:hypothetical protein DPMN_114354 [Dreissena polymorpha]|uniref:Uncharacterized protein n=1 Tax=Dreissena polymorpha TaxID=45954 RepID=A0A9D4KKR4_DREPO|nr:hypothetical protein DPMN_114354 [Dreissena polymorpha]